MGAAGHMIVIGDERLPRWRWARHGSVSHLRRANCPVVIVPPARSTTEAQRRSGGWP